MIITTAMHHLKPGRGACLHVAGRALTLNGTQLATGDGASTEEAGTLTFAAAKPAEALLFDIM